MCFPVIQYVLDFLKRLKHPMKTPAPESGSDTVNLMRTDQQADHGPSSVPFTPAKDDSDEQDSDGLSYVDPTDNGLGPEEGDTSDEDEDKSGSDEGPLVLDAASQNFTFSTA